MNPSHSLHKMIHYILIGATITFLLLLNGCLEPIKTCDERLDCVNTPQDDQLSNSELSDRSNQATNNDPERSSISDGDDASTMDVEMSLCDDGQRRLTETVCGMNDEGFLYEVCMGGVWSLQNDAECSGGDECTNGLLRSTMLPCGINDAGWRQQECQGGMWVDTDGCTDQSVCRDGDIRESDIVWGLNNAGMLLDVCDNGAWRM